MDLSKRDKQLIIACLEQGKSVPPHYQNKLFGGNDGEYIEATKDYKLVYQGKARKEDIIANTPAAPLQKIRSFCTDNPFDGDWQNMLIFGDNLLALKAIYEDQQGRNIYKTKNKIKLIYIDPPFATKLDYLQDREKAYRDKIIGSQFIEFLRKRLVLLREILANDGSIYVHLDWKKGHYIKAIMDEVFGEHNFQREIIWDISVLSGYKTQAANWIRGHDSIFFYTKNSQFVFNKLSVDHRIEYIRRFNKTDENNRRYFDGRGGRRYLDEVLEKGKPIGDVWGDIMSFQQIPTSKEKIGYPTQKTEDLLARIIAASSSLDSDIVLDAFAGSGTTLSVAEKLKRRWIGMDCGKLAIYTIQKRMLYLTTQIGSAKKNDSRDFERVEDFQEHSKASRGLFFIYEKARKGDFIITDVFLRNLAKFIEENLSDNKEQEFSLICPEDKFKVDKLKVLENEEGKAGEKIVSVGKVTFLISFIQPKEKAEKEQPLKAKEFTLYHAGIYDQQLINELDWEKYHLFVAQLFGVRLDQHKIYGFCVDGYIGTYPAYIWPYPKYRDHILDKEYVQGLHKSLGGRAGERLYVVAPVSSMGFMEDEITIRKTTYVFLKVPLSVLMALIEKGEPGALKQPVSEADVNEVIDAIGFDFISQPVIKVNYKRLKPLDRNLWNQKQKDFVVEIKNFKSKTQVYEPDDFENFETLSMALVDCDYNDDYFELSGVFWSDSILDEDRKKAVIRIPQNEFTGKKMMIIFMDKYGNELKVVKAKKDFK